MIDLILVLGVFLLGIVVGLLSADKDDARETIAEANEDCDLCEPLTIEERLENLEEQQDNNERALNNVVDAVNNLVRELARTQEDVLEHKSSFAHPYKTAKEQNIEKAQAFKQAFFNILDEYNLTLEEVIGSQDKEETIAKRKPTKKSKK